MCKRSIEDFILLDQTLQKQKHNLQKDLWSKFLHCVCVNNLEFTGLSVWATC